MKIKLVVLALVLTMFTSIRMVVAGDGQSVEDRSLLGLPSHFVGDVVASLIFGLVLLILMVLGYKFVDWALKGVYFDTELSKNNVAVGIVVASIIIGVCFGVSNIMAAILH